METLIDSHEIPIIDLKLCDKNFDDNDIQRIAKELDLAVSQHGTAFLINHGICEKKRQRASEDFKKFCELSSDAKDQYKAKKNHGYISPNVETFDKNITEIRHAFNFSNTNKSQLPELPGFRENLQLLIQEFTNLQTIILKAFAVALNVPSEFFLRNHGYINDEIQLSTTFRLLYYPAMKDVDFDQIKTDKQTRIGPHADYGTFTLLSQDSEGGLEVIKPGTNVWRSVGHMPNAILLNGGQILRIWSENRYPAIQHRVIIPEDEILKNRERFCHALFIHSIPSFPVAPIKSILNGKCPDGTLTSEEFIKNKLLETFDINYNILDEN